MLRTYASILTSLIAVFASAPLRADSKIRTAATEKATIFLAEIESARPDESCAQFWRGHIPAKCDTRVRARILRIYKQADSTRPAPLEFDAEIHQRAVSGVTPWQTQIDPIQVGQRYLLFSSLKDLPIVFATTPGPVLASGKEDVIGDLEVMLNSESLSLAQQASAVAEAVANPTATRSHLLAEYAAHLLAEGSQTDTALLAKVIEQCSDETFSVLGRWKLLHELAYESQSGSRGPDNLVHVFVTMTARYFLLGRYEGTLLVPDLHEVILTGYIPSILQSERATTMMRQALGPTLHEQFAKKVQEAAAEERHPLTRREQLRQFLGSSALREGTRKPP